MPTAPLKTYRGKEGAGTRGNWVTHKPWCLVRCSPLRRRPCLSRVDRVLQSSPDWPQRSIQSWQASCSQENTLSCDTERLQTPECVFLWLYLMFILEYFSTTQISTMQSFTLYISAYYVEGKSKHFCAYSCNLFLFLIKEWKEIQFNTNIWVIIR